MNLLQWKAPWQSGPQCPPADVWIQIAAGLPVPDADQALDHATHCNRCAALMREAVADLSDELTPEEEDTLASLASSSPIWQRAFAAHSLPLPDHDNKPAPVPERSSGSWPRRVGIAGLAAGLAACGAWFALSLIGAHSPQKLIAAAYAEKRSTELRIEGAPYAPVRQERGGTPSQSRMQRPELLRAESEIAAKLKANPDDVHWLDASGRVGLLENDPTDSISALAKAHLLAPADESVSIDLASAYLEQGQMLDRPEDIGQAVDILGKTVAADPQNQTALFNYALALEKLFLKQQAIAAWQKYVALDPRSSWTREAQDHIARLRAEVKQRSQVVDSPLDSFEQFAAALDSGNPARIATLDSRVEEYQDVAIQQWLPDYFTAPQGPRFDRISRALNGLAELLARRHQDPWLRDMLKADRHSEKVQDAILSLAESERDIANSRDDEARQNAERASSLFTSAHIPAGEARTKFLFAFIDQIRHDDRACEAATRALEGPHILDGYAWLATQVKLEESICGAIGDRRQQAMAQEAEALADAHRYPILKLRAQVMKMGIDSDLGDPHQAWADAYRGLRLFWEGNYPDLRGYNLLVGLDSVMSDAGKPFLQTALLREATPMVEHDPRLTMAAFELTHFGQVLVKAGDLKGAQDCFIKAHERFEKAKDGVQRERLYVESELGFARVSLALGDATSAADRLRKIRAPLVQIPDERLLLDYFQTIAHAELKLGRNGDAANDLKSALTLTEKGLKEVATDDARWKWSRRNLQIYKDLVELDLKADPERAFLAWEWYKGASLRSGMQRVSQVSHARRGPGARLQPASLESTVDPDIPGLDRASLYRLSAGAALISYALLDDGLAVWVVDSRGIHERLVTIDPDALQRQIGVFRSHCADPQSDLHELRRESAALYRQLLLPLEPWLTGHKQLLLEPDGPIDNVPFNLLLDTDGNYLGDTFVLSLSPGIDYLAASIPWTGISQASYTLVMTGADTDGWAPLPQAQEEATSVASSFQHAQLIGAGATHPSSLDASFARAQVFHFSGHSIADARSAGLLAGELDPIRVLESENRRDRHMQLVVLSACSTTLGTTGVFDDESSMVNRLMTVQVPEVVASGWNVDSASTSLLMKAFYAELLQGKSVSAALTIAARTVRGRPEFAHPYYWGGFSAFGLS